MKIEILFQVNRKKNDNRKSKKKKKKNHFKEQIYHIGLHF